MCIALLIFWGEVDGASGAYRGVSVGVRRCVGVWVCECVGVWVFGCVSA